MTRILLPAALLIMAVLIAPETTTPPSEERGYASAYAPNVMAEVIRVRLDNGWWRNPLQRGWYQAHGAIAAMDCSRVGDMATLIAPDGREYRVLIADCAGDDGPADRFSSRGIIAELDWRLFEQLTAAHGRPLEIRMRY